MATNSYIRVPDSNSTRNETELRSVIDSLSSSYQRLRIVKDKMGQMSDGGTAPAGVQAEYNLQTVQDATDVESLVASTVGELDNAPFFQQLISRVS